MFCFEDVLLAQSPEMDRILGQDLEELVSYTNFLFIMANHYVKVIINVNLQYIISMLVAFFMEIKFLALAEVY